MLLPSHLIQGPTISKADSIVGLDPDLAEVTFGRLLGCEVIAFWSPVLWPLELNAPPLEAGSELRARTGEYRDCLWLLCMRGLFPAVRPSFSLCIAEQCEAPMAA